MIELVYNQIEKTWKFIYKDIRPGFLEFSLSMISNRDLIDAKNIKFQIRVYNKNKLIITKNYPKYGRYDILTSGNSIDIVKQWLDADQIYNFELSVQDNDKLIQESYQIFVPKPEQPYELWIWDNDCWAPPKKCPVHYEPFRSVWDQTKQEWLIVHFLDLEKIATLDNSVNTWIKK
jgi:hypothetical protein